jgi:hypothetical protein
MKLAQYLFFHPEQMEIMDTILGVAFVLTIFFIVTLMKNKLRAIIALLKSRAYLDRQHEVAKREPMSRKDSHCECEPEQKYQTEQNDKSQFGRIQPIRWPGELPG